MEKDKVNPLGTEPVGRLLRKFAIPSIISMLSERVTGSTMPN